MHESCSANIKFSNSLLDWKQSKPFYLWCFSIWSTSKCVFYCTGKKF